VPDWVPPPAYGVPLLVAVLGGLGWLIVRWVQRPRLRFQVRSDGLTLDEDRRLAFEVTNSGERPAVIHPTVRMRGVEPVVFGKVRVWYPKLLLRWMTEEQVQERHMYVRLQGYVERRVRVEYVIPEGQERVVAPHSEVELRAAPLGPGRDTHPFVLFRTYSFRLEGRWRRRRVHLGAVNNFVSVPRPRWWAQIVCFHLLGRYPGGVPRGLEEWKAQRARRG